MNTHIPFIHIHQLFMFHHVYFLSSLLNHWEAVGTWPPLLILQHVSPKMKDILLGNTAIFKVHSDIM